MIKKYGFGKTNKHFNDDFVLYGEIDDNYAKQIQKDFTKLKELEICFIGNNKVNFVPWEFVMGIDKVIQYDVYNENLKVVFNIYSNGKNYERYLIPIMKGFDFIKAEYKINGLY